MRPEKTDIVLFLKNVYCGDEVIDKDGDRWLRTLGGLMLLGEDFSGVELPVNTVADYGPFTVPEDTKVYRKVATVDDVAEGAVFEVTYPYLVVSDSIEDHLQSGETFAHVMKYQIETPGAADIYLVKPAPNAISKIIDVAWNELGNAGIEADKLDVRAFVENMQAKGYFNE